jgi:hypothetical protein
MTQPACKHCGANLARRIPSGTVVWRCGTWRHDKKQVGDQSSKCRIDELEAENKRLRDFAAVVRAEKDRLEQLYEEHGPSIVEHRLATSLLDALDALDAPDPARVAESMEAIEGGRTRPVDEVITDLAEPVEVPVFDGRVLVLQHWINNKGVMPPSGQVKLRRDVQELLNKLAGVEVDNRQLRSRLDQRVSRAAEPVETA